MSKKGAGKDFVKGDLIETFIDTGYVKLLTSMLVIVIFATGIGYSYPFYCTLYTHIFRHLNSNHFKIITIYHGVCIKRHHVLHIYYI